MTTEEIIKSLQHCAGNTVDDCEECPAYPWGCEQVYAEAAILLSAQQERENPKPLTLEELRQMDGEPVWIEFIYPGNTCPAHWRIWHTKEYAECELDACGKDWLAYRSKPKEEQK